MQNHRKVARHDRFPARGVEGPPAASGTRGLGTLPRNPQDQPCARSASLRPHAAETSRPGLSGTRGRLPGGDSDSSRLRRFREQRVLTPTGAAPGKCQSGGKGGGRGSGLDAGQVLSDLVSRPLFPSPAARSLTQSETPDPPGRRSRLSDHTATLPLPGTRRPAPWPCQIPTDTPDGDAAGLGVSGTDPRSPRPPAPPPPPALRNPPSSAAPQWSYRPTPK